MKNVEAKKCVFQITNCQGKAFVAVLYMCKLDWCCLFHSRSLQLPQKRHQSQREASQTYEFQGSICFDQSFGFLSPVITQICRCGLPARIMNCREVFLSPNFHICDNHIPATLHRTYNLLKLRSRLVLNDLFIKIIII